MRLMTAHKILIGTAVVFFLFFTGVQLQGMGTGLGSMGAAMLGAVATVVLGLYFWTLRGK